MPELKNIAKEFENGLNKQLGDPQITFRIWTDAGHHTKPRREGNAVFYTIDGILQPTGSENVGANIAMGGMSLRLDFAVPIPPPKTAAYQSDESLNRIDIDQYGFLLKVITAIDTYFSVAENIKLSEEMGGAKKEYSVGIRAGVSIPGLVDIRPTIGESVLVNVYIELGYVEGGVNSREATVAIDTPENILPAIAIELSRENVLASDVYAGKSRRQSVASASAFGIHLKLPLTNKTGQFYDFLTEGKLNVAHFVFYTLGEKKKIYWMTADSPAQAANDVSNIGLDVNLIEVTDDAEIVNVPEGYFVYRILFETSEARNLTVEDNDYLAIGGKVYDFRSQGDGKVTIDTGSYVYDEKKGKYFVYIITYGEFNGKIRGDDGNPLEVEAIDADQNYGDWQSDPQGGEGDPKGTLPVFKYTYGVICWGLLNKPKPITLRFTLSDEKYIIVDGKLYYSTEDHIDIVVGENGFTLRDETENTDNLVRTLGPGYYIFFSTTKEYHGKLYELILHDEEEWEEPISYMNVSGRENDG